MSRNDGLARWARVIGLYAVFGLIVVGIAYVVTRNTQTERERHQLAVEMSRAEQKRQGRFVRAMTDGNCQMQQFDNKSGTVGSVVSMPCDTPLKDITSATRDFNWGR